MTADTEKEHGALLPNGMFDGLPDTAEREARISQSLLQSFSRFGYRQVNPPLVEFEDSLLPDGGTALAHNTFRLMDPISRRMMAIRPDATIQIARIAASRLKSSPRPLRLSYVADVMRVKASQLRPERQFKQVGCELLGLGSSEASAEAALLSVVALSDLGIKNISIDFATPEIIRTLASTHEDSDAFIRTCQRRDEDALKKFGESGKMMIKLNQASGPADEFFKQIKTLKLQPGLKASFTKLQAVITDFRAGLDAYGLDKVITLTVDALETKGFEYETTPSFTLFARGIRGELGRGGFYEALFQLGPKKQHKEPATGFTLYMDSMLRAVTAQDNIKRIFVPAGTSWSEGRALQEQGYVVIRGGADKASAKELAGMNCTHVYKSKKIQTV
jgi:ATP phosphoribosyltransferase regulatory subunit